MVDTDDSRERRPRDAAATRAAILAAARTQFSCEGYDAVGVRDIAAAAGVDPALVIRYFGSKEGLFASAVFTGIGQAKLFAGEQAQLGARLAHMLATKKEHGGFDPILALIRSSLSPTTGPKIRDVIDEQVIAPLAEYLGGPAAEARAALLMSQVLGFFMARLVLQNQALVATDPATLAALLQPVLQLYVDGLDLPNAQPDTDASPDSGDPCT